MTEIKNETYYEILRVNRGASIAEIVAAYNCARAAFAKDSVATYSLLSAEDTNQVLQKLEEAYLTLSNVDKKRDYDKRLTVSFEVPNEEIEETSMPVYNAPQTNDELNRTSEMQPTVEESTDPRLSLPAVVNGQLLKDIRQKRSLSLDDVSRVTKIPLKFLKALEDEIDKDMPARVYVQGFIKNLANLYKLEPQQTAKAFLAYLDEKKRSH